MSYNSAKSIAFGGVTAALAAVIVSLGGMIPVATYVSPMLCCVLLLFVVKRCGNRIAWAWYVAVCIIGLLVGPDKEAALVFIVLGYYPIIKPKVDKLHLRWLVKLAIFNVSIAISYILFFAVVGIEDPSMTPGGIVLGVILVLMGNLTFFLVDRLLSILSYKLDHKKGKHT